MKKKQTQPDRSKGDTAMSEDGFKRIRGISGLTSPPEYNLYFKEVRETTTIKLTFRMVKKSDKSESYQLEYMVKI